MKKSQKKYFGKISPKFSQHDEGIYLPSFVAIGLAVLTLSWGQGKLRPALAA